MQVPAGAGQQTHSAKPAQLGQTLPPPQQVGRGSPAPWQSVEPAGQMIGGRVVVDVVVVVVLVVVVVDVVVVGRQLPPRQVAFAPQATQAPPPTPQAPGLVPGWQVPCASQQPRQVRGPQGSGVVVVVVVDVVVVVVVVAG